MRFPDFYCIGVQKAGTTWLFENLRSHPKVHVPFLKEVHYFDSLYLSGYDVIGKKYRQLKRKNAIEWNSQAYERTFKQHYFNKAEYIKSITEGKLTDDWYAQYFNFAKSGQIIGELTPEYSLLPNNGINHILNLNESIKVFIILRNPIERDLSAIRMYWKREDSKYSNLKVPYLLVNDLRVTRRSNYIGIIEKWERMIEKKNFKIFFFEDIIHRPIQLLREVCQFIGVDSDSYEFKHAHKKVFEGPQIELPKEIRPILEKRHEKTLAYFNEHYGRKWA